jgi:streptomycin 6-kinase
VTLSIPTRLAATCGRLSDGSAWLARLPAMLSELERRWSMALGPPFDGEEVSCAWIAPVVLRNRGGRSAVLKVALPHMESRDEIEGLRFWNGDPTVRLLESDDALGAMLIERCEPGTHLRSEPEREQDVVIAGLLRRLWRTPSGPIPVSAAACDD